MMRAPGVEPLSRHLIFVADVGYRIVDDTSPTVRDSIVSSSDFTRFLDKVLPLGPVPLSFAFEE